MTWRTDVATAGDVFQQGWVGEGNNFIDAQLPVDGNNAPFLIPNESGLWVHEEEQQHLHLHIRPAFVLLLIIKERGKPEPYFFLLESLPFHLVETVCV